MANKARTTTNKAPAAAAAAPIPPAAPAAPDEDFEPEDVALMDLLAGLPGGGTAIVRIYRQGASARDLILLDEVAPEEFTPMMLAHAPYLGGKFRLHIQNNGAMIRNMELRVQRAAGAVAPPEPGTAAPAAVAPDVLSIVRELSAGFERSIEKLAQAMAPQAVNPLQSLDGLKQLAEIVRPPVSTAPAGNDFHSMMKSFASFNELIEKMRPAPALVNGDGEVSMPAMAMEFLKTLAEMRRAPAPAALTDKTAPAGTAAADGLTDQQREEINEMNILLKFQLRSAIKAAAGGVDAVKYAETIYPVIPDEILVTMATQPDWFASACAVVPECAPHEAWFTIVADTIRKMAIEDEVIPAPAPPAPPGPPQFVDQTQSAANAEPPLKS